MRLIGGERGSFPLETPPSRATRPTSSRARQALFDKLQHRYAEAWAQTPHLHVLDAFAGSGAFGLEALSRWGGTAFFFETDQRARKVLQRNVRKCQLSAEIYPRSALTPFACPLPSRAGIDLAFFDPPYALRDAQKAPAAFAQKAWFARHALIVFQTAPARNSAAPSLDIGDDFLLVEAFRCGFACFSLFRYEETRSAKSLLRAKSARAQG